MIDDDTTVYLGRGGYVQVYHTDRDCEYIADKDDHEVRETTPAAVEPHKRPCEVCAGDADYGGRGDPSPTDQYTLSKRAGEDADHLERVRDNA